MGLNLAGGLAAVDGFFQAQEHQQDRDYLQKQRDYQRQIMQAGLDTLPDQTGADLARLRLSAATSTAGLDTLPAQTAADQARLSLSTATSNAGLDTLPGATKNTLARQGLDSSDLAFQATQQPKTQQVAAATTDRAVADIPELETQRVATNADKFNERQMHAYQAFATSLKNNDKEGALQIANQWASTEALRAGTVGKKFIDIRPTGEGDAHKYQLVADDNTTFDIPAATLKAAADRAKTGKYSMHQGKEGEVYTFNENTGAIERKVAPRAGYGGGGASGNALLPPETITVMAEQYLAGDTSVLQNLGRGAQGAENIVKVRNEIARLTKEGGKGGADLAAQNAEYFGTKAGQRAAGTRIANVEMAVQEARNLIPLARQASAEVARSSFLPFGKVQVMFNEQTNDPAMRRFAASNNAIVNTYARAISPSGVPTVSGTEHARKMLAEAMDHKSYVAVLDQMDQEMSAAQQAPQHVRKMFNDAVTGKGGHGAPTVPNPVAAPAIPAGWSVEVH